ncbi:MAG: glycosyltransferase family 4 protein [Candidatus Woesebacteria bacterium]|jgi:glycosyltransferase involved in cell wall biosynthesis
MNILFFSSYFHPYISGITTYPLKLFSHLVNKYQITVLTFKHDQNLESKEKIKDLKIIRMPFLFKLSKGFISLRSVLYFSQYARKNDLIILNIPNAEGFLLVLIAKLFKKKVLLIYHCQVFLDGSLFNQIINKILNLSVSCQLKMSDQIIFYTKDYFNSLKSLKKYRYKTKFVFPPVSKLAVDKNYLSDLIAKKNKKTWIGFAGRVAREKGIEYLIKALSRLDKKNFALIFAGPFAKQVVGEEAYYQSIVRQLERSKIEYYFLGLLKGKKLGAFYKAIDVLVLPSINQTEAFGMVQVESVFSGTPVIASNLAGVRQVIKRTKMGLLVSKANEEELAKAVQRVLKNKERYANNRLIRNAEKIFDENKNYRFYENLIEKMMK